MRAMRAVAAVLAVLAAFFALFLVAPSSSEGVACSASSTEDCDAGLRSGFRSEAVVHLKPKASLVPESQLSSIADVQKTPDNILPGIVSELTKGIDITSGDPFNLVQKQIFIWTYDMDHKMNWNGKLFAIPDQVSIFLKNVCRISEITTTSMSTSFTESTTSQAEGWSAGFDQKVDIGIEYKGVGMETQIQNTMMFGESSISREYESQFHQERTMSMSTSSRAEAYNSQLYDEKMNDSWFHPWFKDAAQSFGKKPTKRMAFDIFDDYGTHFIQEAELGGSAIRNVYFHEVIDKKAAESYFNEASESTIGWLWFSGSKSDSETTETKSSSGEQGSVYTSATTIIGGDPSAETPGQFCASLEHYQTPRVLAFKKLVPIWNIIDQIGGVPKGTGKKMLKHVEKFWEEGERCGVTTCGGQVSMCSWQPLKRTWGLPCKCLSKAAREINIEGYTVESVEFERADGVKAKFAGWTMFKESSNEYGDEFTVDRYNIDIKGDCFTWEDGKTGRSLLKPHGNRSLWEHVWVTVNVPPHTMMDVCFDFECSDQSENGVIENRTDKIIQHTYRSGQVPWTDPGSAMPNFYVELFYGPPEGYKAAKMEL